MTRDDESWEDGEYARILRGGDGTNLLSPKAFANLNTTKQHIAAVGSFFKQRFKNVSANVYTNRVWLKSTQTSRICDVLVTLRPHERYETVFTLLDALLKKELIVRVKYHHSTQAIAFYISASYER